MTQIIVLPCADSRAHAYIVRNALALRRDIAERFGIEAVRISTSGEYVAPDGRRVNIVDAVANAVAQTVNILPDAALPDAPSTAPTETLTISVANETSFAAAQRLIAGGKHPLVLNFASGTSPGGGFLRGSTAQEETLARSSGLYVAIKNSPMYSYHKTQCERGMASAWAVLSPAVPVFRADNGILLHAVWECDILTCAAPKADKVGLDVATPVMRERIDRVLSIARAYGYRSLVLGAWGCGAYHNDPHAVAAFFREALTETFLGAFDDAVFAVADWSEARSVLTPFADAFAAPPV